LCRIKTKAVPTCSFVGCSAPLDATEEAFEREKWVWFSDKFFGSIPQSELDELAEPYILFYQREGSQTN